MSSYRQPTELSTVPVNNKIGYEGNTMKNLINSMMITFGLCMASSALAYVDTNTTITEVYINNKGELLFKTSGFSGVSTLGCTKTNYIKADYNNDASIREIMHRNLLTAKATGATVWLRATGCNYYPLVNIISVQ